MAQADRFLKACRREPVDATPIWLMRQAGRYMAEYRALREKYTILELIKTPELAAEVTFQPLHAFDVDAAIIFADILTLPEAMGMDLEFVAGEGPVFHNPLRSADDIRKLSVCDPTEALAFTLDAIRLVNRELDGRLPLIGFSGAPFTLACYGIEGGSSRNFVTTKSLMYSEPEAWHRLMEVFSDAAERYLVAQAEAGAAALQLFDSWAGILSPADYAAYVLPHTRRLIDSVRQATDTPLIYFGTDTAGLLPCIRDIGATVIGVDWRIELDSAWRIIGDDKAVQGNLDPVSLFSNVTAIKAQADRILEQAGGRPGHIFNLGHGVLPGTPTDHVAALIDHVHAHTLHAP